MQLFYTPHIDNQVAKFEGEEARHIVQVLRYKVGQEIRFIDGNGSFYTGKLTELSKKNCLASIQTVESSYNKRNFHLTIAIAPTKNISRFEWFLEKSTEIGIDKIVPLLCNRSVRKNIRLDRLEKILLSATKQSLKAKIPELTDFMKVEDFIKTSDLNGKKYIAHCEETDRLLLSKEYQQEENVIIMIGPEGDFTPEEIALAVGNDFKAVSLGQSRLRTETAGIVACHTINLKNE